MVYIFNACCSISPLGVNFTNILWAAFAPKSFHQKITNPNFKHIKGAQRTLVWKSCLQNIGEIYSHTKVICTAFKCLQFGFVIFWQKDFGAKDAHKMLVKLTPGLCTQAFQFGIFLKLLHIISVLLFFVNSCRLRCFTFV